MTLQNPFQPGDSLTLNSSKLETGGCVNNIPFHFLHTTHWLSTFFATCLPFGTQNLERNSASVPLTPLCKTLRWHWICRYVKRWFLGKIIGSFASCGKSEYSKCPLHQSTPLQSSHSPNVLTSCLKLSSCFNSFFATLIQSFSTSVNSCNVRASFFRSFFFLLLLNVKTKPFNPRSHSQKLSCTTVPFNPYNSV